MSHERVPPVTPSRTRERRAGAATDGARGAGAGGLLRPGQVEVPVSWMLEKYVTKKIRARWRARRLLGGRGRAGALSWGRRTPGISPCPPPPSPPNPGGTTLAVVPTPGKRRAHPTCGARCGRGAGSALSPPARPPLPAAGPSAAGAAGRGAVGGGGGGV